MCVSQYLRNEEGSISYVFVTNPGWFSISIKARGWQIEMRNFSSLKNTQKLTLLRKFILAWNNWEDQMFMYVYYVGNAAWVVETWANKISKFVCYKSCLRLKNKDGQISVFLS